MPWWDDLYLDIVVLPDGYLELQDAEELQEALQVGSINRSQFDLAHREAERIMTELKSDYVGVMAYAKLHYQQLLPLVK